MNAARLNELLARPQTMAGEDLVALENLCRDFPAFGLPFILLAKAYHDRNDYRYKECLHSAALRCPNRAWLHTYITTTQKETEAETPLREAIQSAIPDSPLQNPITTAEYAVEAEPAVKAVENKVIPNGDDSTEVPAPEAEDGSRTDIKPQSLPYPPEPEKTAEKSGTKEQETVSKSAKRTELPPAAVEKPWRGRHVDPAAMTVYSIEDHFPPVEEDSEAPGGRDFFTWLRNPNKHNEPAPSKPEIREEKDDLIRRFLETRPSVSRPKKDFFNPVNMARQSEQEDTGLVTETLANIYLQQGNTGKAIAMFEQLILKYPGKRPYFAALIQKIRQAKDL